MNETKITKKDLWRMRSQTTSQLCRWVIDDVLELHGDTDEELQNYLLDVCRYGCQSGVCNSLIYTSDCRKFVTENIDEVLEIYNENKEFIAEDELSVDKLAWMAYEYICSLILDGEPVEDFNM